MEVHCDNQATMSIAEDPVIDTLLKKRLKTKASPLTRKDQDADF